MSQIQLLIVPQFIAQEAWMNKGAHLKKVQKRQLATKEDNATMKIQHDFEDNLSRSKLSKKIRDELKMVFKNNVIHTQSNTRKGSRAISFKTQELKVINIISSLDELIFKGKYEIHSIFNLKEKHIEYLIQLWIDDGKATGTIANKVTYLKGFAEWIKKPNLVKNMRDYPAIAKLEKRTSIAKVDGSWTAKSINPDELIAKIAIDEPHVAVQLMLQYTFGLRKLESMLLRPRESLFVDRNMQYLKLFKLEIHRGAKNGRDRLIVHPETDLEVLHLAQKLTNPRTGSTIPDEYNLKKLDKPLQPRDGKVRYYQS